MLLLPTVENSFSVKWHTSSFSQFLSHTDEDLKKQKKIFFFLEASNYVHYYIYRNLDNDCFVRLLERHKEITVMIFIIAVIEILNMM